MGALLGDADADLRTAVTLTHNSYDPLDQHPDAPGATEVYLREPSGAMTWVSQGDAGTPSALTAAIYEGHSADWSHVFFGSPKQLAPAAAGLVSGASLVYDRSGGRTELISVNTDGTLISRCGAAVGSLGDLEYGDGGSAFRTAVSRDGNRIAFTSPEPAQLSLMPDPSCGDPAQVYVRDGDQTVHASLSQRATADPVGDTGRAVYQGSSIDGDKVLFTSDEALTDDAQPLTVPGAPFLYEYDVPSRTLKLVTPNRPDGSGPNVTGVVTISDDGRHVYYVVDNNRLELYDGTASRTVATGSNMGDGLVGNLPGNLAETARQARLSADGTRLLFATVASITPDFDNHGFREVYLYDSRSSQLECVSCNEDGHAPLGDADLKPDRQGSSLKAQNLLEDGRVLFETMDSLVTRDTNRAMDVYAWRAGSLQLISDGRSGSSYFVDASSDGRDIFFSSTASLVGSDVDNGGMDMYDARVDGGFEEPPPPPPACEGEACQGAAGGAPVVPSAGSVTFVGAGDATTPTPRRGSAAPRVSKPKAVRGTSAKLRVRLPAAGRLRVSGSGLKTTSRSIARVGSVTITVSLTSRGRRSLSRARTLKVKARVVFAPSDGKASTVTVPLTFRANTTQAKERS